MTDAPSFSAFYEAVHERPPLPWQQRLADTVVKSGWPSEIGVPTGLGKTSSIDIAVWALASQAELAPSARTLPTRVWYVVNRRLLVDAAFEHGIRLSDLLAEVSDGPVRDVADRLRSMRGFGGQADRPLTVSRLRGGAELGARPPHPSHPALVFATVPMFGSSWLFRGYASSQRMRSVDAAHAGIDSLVLLDEAHLSRPLQDLSEPVAQCDIGDPGQVLTPSRSRVQISSLTATGHAQDPFTLDDDDHRHSIVRARLNAAKPTRLVAAAKRCKQLAPTLVSQFLAAVEEREAACASVIFTNTPARARETFDRLRKEAARRNSPLAGADLLLLTGRMRSRESDTVRAQVLDPSEGAPAGRRPEAPRQRHLAVVATQTLEVGADLDFDLLVTESCGARSLVQRFGRLNRLGVADDPSAVIVHPNAERDWEVYRTEPREVWDRLSAAADDEEFVDLTPERIGDVVGPPSDEPPRVGELLPAHLWEWAKTTTPPPGEAPVELFFEGFDTSGARVSVLWRSVIPQLGARLVPSVSIDEVVELPLHEVREVLTERLGDDAEVSRLSADRVTVELSTVQRLRPADILVLDGTDGLYDEFGWSPTSHEEVLDVSLDRWPGLPLDTMALEHWTAPSPRRDDLMDDLEGIGSELRHDDEADVDGLADSAIALVHRLEPIDEVREAWLELTSELQRRVELDESLLMLPRASAARARRESHLVAADACDDLSATARSASLHDHLESVGQIAERIAIAVGLPNELVTIVTAAGRFHDLGKADGRFQRWLDPGFESTVLLAKSSSPRTRWRAEREQSGWPLGGRHEALSARLVAEWLEEDGHRRHDADLLTHLVISHHGYGRPLVPAADDPAPATCSVPVDGKNVAVSGDLSTIDWEQPSRFRRCCERYGYWGVALLEAIVRQADHLASAALNDAPAGVA